MRAFTGKILPVGLVLVSLALGGCLLISGTFVVTESFSFDVSDYLSFQAVDLTENSDWQDHKDNIDMIDAVGFTMTMDNSNGSAVTFNLYVAPYADKQLYNTLIDFQQAVTDGDVYVVIKDLTVPAGTSTVTYAQSLTHLHNLDKLKELTKTGKLHLYATTSLAGSFTVDPGSIVVTVSGSK
jgi:hypothetical protein